jgi:hypothetical protein
MQTRLFFWSEMVMVRIRLVDRLFCIAGLSTAACGIIGRCAAAMSSALRTAVRRLKKTHSVEVIVVFMVMKRQPTPSLHFSDIL